MVAPMLQLCMNCGHARREHTQEYTSQLADCTHDIDADYDDELGRYVRTGGCKCTEFEADTLTLLHLLDADSLVPTLVAYHLAERVAEAGWTITLGVAGDSVRWTATISDGPDGILHARLVGTLDGGLHVKTSAAFTSIEARFDDGIIAEWADDVWDYLENVMADAREQLADADLGEQ